MRFFLFGSLLTTAATIAAVDTLFDDSFDASDFLDIPQNGLQDVSQDSSLDWLSKDVNIIPNENLFNDPDLTDFVSTTTNVDFPDLLTSCSVDEQQSWNILRARDGENSCVNPVPFQDDSSEALDGLMRLGNGDSLLNLMKPISSDPSLEDPTSPVFIPTELKDKNVCRPEYPAHLCCRQLGPFLELRADIEIYKAAHLCLFSMLSSLLVEIVKSCIGF